jgi:hypothetical protein
MSRTRSHFTLEPPSTGHRHMMLDVADAVAAGQGRRAYHFPLALRALIAEHGALGVSGSRDPDDGSLHALGELLAAWDWMELGPVLVGDQRGVDEATAATLYGCQVFRREGNTPAALVARSIRMLDALGRLNRPLLAAFPAKPCPEPIAPGPRWASGGSGTWSTAALALGRGMRVVLWLPSPMLAPVARWPLSYLGGGWWVSRGD